MRDELFVPALIPFTFHWYDGVLPPLTGVALNVTEVPAHTGLAVAEMAMLTGISGFTVMVIVLEVAGLPEAQLKFEVRIHRTWSLFDGM